MTEFHTATLSLIYSHLDLLQSHPPLPFALMNAISGLIRRTDFGAGWAARYVRRPAVYKETKREFSMSMGALHSTQRKVDLHMLD